jgi:CubicO group peptidase (beta-lactamase class C family)
MQVLMSAACARMSPHQLLLEKPRDQPRFLGGALALACLPSSAIANESMANSPREWFDRWFTAFNGSRLADYAKFVHAHIPSLVPFLDDDLGLREASGGFSLLRSEQTAPNEITAWVRDRHWDRFSKVVMMIGDGRIDDLTFSGAPTPADLHVQRLSEGSALDALHRKLHVESAKGRFSGVVLVARGREVLFQEAYGAQSIQPEHRTTIRTRFCIGSMGKMFTAVAVLQLVQQGRLKLTDTLATLLPAHPDTALARQVTVEQLLTHSGGTGDFFGTEYEKRRAELNTPSDYIRIFGAREPIFPPGSRWGYSNFGFMLLGAIVEQVTGTPWEACLNERVFRVAGMISTSASASPSDTASPCTGARATGLRTLPYYAGSPAGGGYSTSDDLHRFGVALTEGRLLDAAHLALLTQPRIPAGTASWSLGLRVATRNGATWFGHGGAAPGVNADFAIYAGTGYRTVVLSNRGHPSAVNVADYIGARLPKGA